MNKSLVLAEKPSVARDFSRVLKCTKKEKGYFEGNNMVITWALGHLIELAPPEVYDEKFKTWNCDDLPIIPSQLQLEIIKQSARQYHIIKKLLYRNDINEIIIATDAGREGELVARWILEKSKVKKTIKRLWISSVTDKAITEGFKHLKDGRDYNNLYSSAVARAQADWFVGINATRALTCKYNAQLSCGRVQTPTLNLVAHRQQTIKNFTPKDYYQINIKSGGISFLWRDKTTKESRIFDKISAEKLLNEINGGQLKIKSVETRKKSVPSPSLYDLTTLQREANKIFHFSPKETLSILQRLYEYHKVLTYPRTDSRYISSDMVETLPQRLKALSFSGYGNYVSKIKGKQIKSQKHFVNNNKVTDHHAIIPTEEGISPGVLSSGEEKIYDMVAKRFLAILHPLYEYEEILIKGEIKGYEFTAAGKNVLAKGWKTLYEDEHIGEFPTVNKNEILFLNELKLIKGTTKPPSLFTEGTLLAAMENPSKYLNVNNKSFKEVLEETGGLGTVATRADIIEKLYNKGFMEKKGEYIYITNKGEQLLTLVPPDIKSPDLTAKWELKLSGIKQGEVNKKDFLKEIIFYTKNVVEQIKNSDSNYIHENITGDKCPKCGNPMLKESDKRGEVLICSQGSCRHRIRLSIKTNARCPNCHKSLSLFGEGDGQIFVCSCGYREKLTAFQQKKKKQTQNISKKEAQKFMKKNNEKEPENNPFKDALLGFKLKDN